MEVYLSATIEGFDAESLLGVVRDTRFDQRLLARGHFRARVRRVVFDGFSLDSGEYSLPVFASGSFGEKVMALAIALRCEDAMWANGRAVAPGELMVFSEDQQLDVRPPVGTWQWAVVLVPRERLQQASLAYLGRELVLPETGWQSHAQWRAHGIGSAISGTLEAAARWTAATPAWVVAEAGESLLAACVHDLWDAGRGASMPNPGRGGRDAGGLIRQAEGLIREHYAAGLSSHELSCCLGVGERQVERLFQKAYGMSPQRWQQVVRLNMARQALLHAQAGEHITDVALRMGFGHLGRFSSRYRELFGEVPRDTLQQARRTHGAR